LVILLVTLVALVGCNDAGGGSDEGAGERPAKLKRCEPGEDD
jgi:hypothetical protein